jgi:hypothetical protein
VVESARGGLVHEFGLLLELRQLPFDVVDEQVGHIVAEAPLDHDPQRCEVLPIFRERVGRQEPPALAQPVRDVEDRVVVDSVGERECEERQLIDAGRTCRDVK